jgi:hypothetical protein
MEKLVRCTQTRSKLMCYNYHDGEKAFSASGGMVYTLVLEASAERIESSSLSLRTKFR